MDHGVRGAIPPPSGWTRFLVWLMKQGVRCNFSAIRHPQTQGKVERFHQPLERARTRRGRQAEWLTQEWLDGFREERNHVRPHEALGLRTPASLWQPSLRKYQPRPPVWDYGAGAERKRVSVDGDLYAGGRRWTVSQALAPEPVELKRVDQRILVYYCRTLVRQINPADQRSTAGDLWSQPANL